LDGTVLPQIKESLLLIFAGCLPGISGLEMNLSGSMKKHLTIREDDEGSRPPK